MPRPATPACGLAAAPDAATAVASVNCPSPSLLVSIQPVALLPLNRGLSTKLSPPRPRNRSWRAPTMTTLQFTRCIGRCGVPPSSTSLVSVELVGIPGTTPLVVADGFLVGHEQLHQPVAIHAPDADVVGVDDEAREHAGEARRWRAAASRRRRSCTDLSPPFCTIQYATSRMPYTSSTAVTRMRSVENADEVDFLSRPAMN